MDRDEALELLRGGKEGVAEWNRRRKAGHTVPDLSGAKLRQADLEEAKLVKANLSGADLLEADLRGAKLRQADLSGAKLVGADLSGAHVRSAKLFGADLRVANLRGANLNCANLNQADLSEADLRGAKLRQAGLIEANLSGADLSEADLRDAEMEGADFNGANLSGANLSDCHCVGTHFANVDLSVANGLEETNHRGPSSIDHRTLAKSKGKIPEAFLRGCGLQDWEIEAAKLYGDLTEAERTNIMYRVLELRRDSPIAYYSVFISHSSANKPFARALEAELQERGIRSWLDEKQILPGDDIHDTIDHGIKHWDKVILCCSREALEKSWWVEVEIDKALAKEQRMRKEGRKALALIPLTIDDYVFNHWDNGRKSVVTGRKVADFTGWNEGEPLPSGVLDQLIRALQLDDTGREPPPEPRL